MLAVKQLYYKFILFLQNQKVHYLFQISPLLVLTLSQIKKSPQYSILF
jgi:hypothetical protein